MPLFIKLTWHQPLNRGAAESKEKGVNNNNDVEAKGQGQCTLKQFLKPYSEKTLLFVTLHLLFAKNLTNFDQNCMVKLA